MRLLVLALAALSLNAQVNFYSREKEAALGAQLAAEATKDTTPLGSAAAADYINKVVRRLAVAMPNQSYTFTIALVKDDLGGSTHEPTALPAGYIFVPAGLLLAAQNEAELAGMLAHAMVHVTSRHYTQLATRTELAQIGTYPLHPLSPLNPRDNPWAVPAPMLAIMRSFERQADYVAAATAAAAGYDPAAFAAYISRTQTDQPDPFAALPNRADRIAGIEQAIKAIRRMGPHDYAPTGAEFAQIQAEVRKLTP